MPTAGGPPHPAEPVPLVPASAPGALLARLLPALPVPLIDESTPSRATFLFGAAFFGAAFFGAAAFFLAAGFARPSPPAFLAGALFFFAAISCAPFDRIQAEEHRAAA